MQYDELKNTHKDFIKQFIEALRARLKVCNEFAGIW